MYSNLGMSVNRAWKRDIEKRSYERNYENSIIDVFVTIIQVGVVTDELFEFDGYEEFDEYEEED